RCRTSPQEKSAEPPQPLRARQSASGNTSDSRAPMGSPSHLALSLDHCEPRRPSRVSNRSSKVKIRQLANAGLMEIFMVHHEAASRKGDAGFTMEPVRAFD